MVELRDDYGGGSGLIGIMVLTVADASDDKGGGKQQ